MGDEELPLVTDEQGAVGRKFEALQKVGWGELAAVIPRQLDGRKGIR
jgi:hypothetical protein